MGDRQERPTEPLDPIVLARLIDEQRDARFAMGSAQQPAEPRPTVKMHKDELLGLLGRGSDAPALPRAQVVGAVDGEVANAAGVVAVVPSPTPARWRLTLLFALAMVFVFLATR